MPTFRQAAAGAAVVVPVLVASGLAIGGYHNRPLAVACFVVAGCCLLAVCFWVPLQRWRWRTTGRTPIRPWHKVIGGRAVLRLDLGTEPAVSEVVCEVHIPHYMFVGGRPRATTGPLPIQGVRLVIASFPDHFGLAPVFRQARCVGWYHVNWIVTQFGEQRVFRDKFRIRRFGVIAMTRLAWERRGEQSFPLWLATAGVVAFLHLTRLDRSPTVKRAWDRLFASQPASTNDAAPE